MHKKNFRDFALKILAWGPMNLTPFPLYSVSRTVGVSERAWLYRTIFSLEPTLSLRPPRIGKGRAYF